VNTLLQAPCDRELGRGARASAAKHPRWTIAATMMASSLSFIDGSVTNVALPAIGQDLSADAGSLPWVINAYLLPLSALLLIGGAAGDHFGRKRMLIAGILLFAAASIGCALAPNLDALLAFRGLQGVGAAILLPNSLGILGSSFEGEARGRAVGTWAAAGAIASAIGPPLGGWLVETVGWPAIFYLNLPVAAAAVLIAVLFVDESVEDGRKLDWRGAALATAALGLLTWGLTLWSSTHSATPASLGGVGAGAVLFLAFLWTERRLGEKAMMPLSLFASRPFVGLTVLTLLLYGALGGLLVLLPYLLIVGGGYSPIEAGLALLPFSLVLGVASRLTGRLTERIGPRWPLTIGPIVTGIGFALFAWTDPAASYWTSVLPAVAVISAGMALAVAPLTTTVLASVDEKHTGTASGFNSAVARTGGLIATALAGAVLSMTGAGLTDAFHAAAIVAAVFAVAAGLAAFFTLEGRKPA
jgi:EmrB/QacA subfamily drug resistance transporter